MGRKRIDNVPGSMTPLSKRQRFFQSVLEEPTTCHEKTLPVVDPTSSVPTTIDVATESKLGQIFLNQGDIHGDDVVEQCVSASIPEAIVSDEDNNDDDDDNQLISSVGVGYFGQASYQQSRAGVIVDYKDFGDDAYTCHHCAAYFWSDEALQKKKNNQLIYTHCCEKGKVELPISYPTPHFLDELLNPNNGRRSVLFRDNIRVYNSMFAFTSMGADIQHNINSGGAPYVFKICGQVHHKMGSVLPSEGKSPQYAQLYVYDTQNEISNRMTAIDPNNVNYKIDVDIVKGLVKLLDECNELTREYRSVRDDYESRSLQNFDMIILDREKNDSKQYELPSTSEIGGLIVGDIGEFNSNRDIIIRSNGGSLKRISKIHPKLMSLQYPLLFPYGEDGFKINMKLKSMPGDGDDKKRKLTISKFACYQIHDRAGQSSTLLKGGRLFQQYLVDIYATVEENRLEYVRHHQPELRSETWNNLTTFASNGIVEGSDVGKRIYLPGSHTGSPRDMINNYQDAMTICREYGNPDLFVTFTCNVKWPEILRYFEKRPGYKAEDRPDIICRIFKIKVDDMIAYIKGGELFGEVSAHVCTIEFQKRGLPHAHLLFWLKNKYKCYTADDVDSIISAELPDKNIDPKLFEIVSQFMIHGPCGQLNPSSPCMKNKLCTKHFPKPFISNTIFQAIKSPQYRRRDDGSRFVVKKGVEVGNNYVVPYNANLLLRYNAHINVESCSQSMLIKYLFKYINKGPDRARAMIRDNVNDEIQNYLNCRYLTPHESVWRLFEFSIHSRYPAVQYLKIHLPNEQTVCFHESNSLENVLNNPGIETTMLTAWFIANRTYKTAKKLTYTQFPTKFVWNNNQKLWTRRKKKYQVLGRIAHVPPNAGELYYLRMLLNVQKGCTNFRTIKTINGKAYSTYQEACRGLGLLGDDKEWLEALLESTFTATATQIRYLFVTIILFCNVSDPRALLDAYWVNMSDDISHKIRSTFNMPNLSIPDDELKDGVLHELEKLFNMSSSSLKKHQLPMPKSQGIHELENRFIREELNFDCEALKQEHFNLVTKLNTNQKIIYDEVIKAVEEKNARSFFVYGCGGTGKTFLWNTIISRLRSKGKIVLAVASSGIASLLLPIGRTAHSRFGIKPVIDKDSSCNINKKSHLSALIEKAELIVWDEAPMCNKWCIESVDRTLRDILSKKEEPFGGKTILFGGDFRQTLPVIQGGSKEQVIQQSFNNSYLWPAITVFHLTENMRLSTIGLSSTEKDEIKDFAEWILRIGEGRLESKFPTGDPDVGWIDIPEELLIDPTIDPIESIFQATYPNFLYRYNDANYLRERAIVTPKNVIVREINNYAIKLLPGDEKSYFSSDSISYNSGNSDNINLLYPMEFLNKLEFSGLPTHELILKIGMPIMLLRNLDQIRGLCNGTRLIVTKLFERLIEAKILTGNNTGEKVHIPRIVLHATETKWPFTFKRRQFPVRPCYAMTINKSQGQSLNQVGIYLSESVFTHGQLYVALSRVTSKKGLKIFIKNSYDIPNNCTKNIVYKDVLQGI